MRMEFAKYRLDVPFFDAIDKRDIIVPEMSAKKHSQPNLSAGVLACAMSHIEVLRRAQTLELPAVCIFEDDAILSDDFGGRIEYLQNLPDLDFDIFCLGGHYPIKENWHEIRPGGNAASATKWPYVYAVREMGGTYGYVITKDAYEWVLRNWTYNFGMDEFLSTFVYRNFKTYAFTPFLVGTRQDCVSEITGDGDGYVNATWHFSNEKIKL